MSAATTLPWRLRSMLSGDDAAQLDDHSQHLVPHPVRIPGSEHVDMEVPFRQVAMEEDVTLQPELVDLRHELVHSTQWKGNIELGWHSELVDRLGDRLAVRPEPVIDNSR